MGPFPYEKYDKKSYSESKRRRRQVLMQSETGYIKPYRRSKKRIIIAVCAAGALLLAAAITAVFTLLPRQMEAQSTDVRLSAAERLRVVNRASPLEKDYVPQLGKFDSVPVSAGIVHELEEMRGKAAEQGIELKVTAGYIPYDEQKKLYEANLAEFTKNPDYTPVRAQAAAQRIIPDAGCCEAQTGLLVQFDVTDPLAKAFIERECINFGFIQRYAENKQDKTHMQPSESAYRYVGSYDAGKMRAFDMCLEEYSEYTDDQSAVTLK